MKIMKLKSIKKIDPPSDRYELTVKDNHNFFVNGVLKHNCSALIEYDGEKKKLGHFYVCSRNIAFKKNGGNDQWNFAVKNDLDQKIRDFYKKTGKLLAIQAEQCGPGIQSNIYCLKEIEWFVYLIVDQVTGRQLNVDEMCEAAKSLGLKTVPIIWRGRLGDLMPNVEAAIEYAEKQYWTPDEYKLDESSAKKIGKGRLWVDYFQHEGVVVRSVNCDKKNHVGLSCKIKNLAYNEKGLPSIAEAARTWRVNHPLEKNTK